MGRPHRAGRLWALNAQLGAGMDLGNAKDSLQGLECNVWNVGMEVLQTGGLVRQGVLGARAIADAEAHDKFAGASEAGRKDRRWRR